MDASEVARVVVAPAVAVALAVLGAHPRVLRWERRLGLTVLASSGFPAPANLDLLLRRWKSSVRLVLEVTRFDQLAALGIPGFIAIVFRPDHEVNAAISRPAPEPRPSPDPPALPT